MHYMNANETDGEKAWRQLRKNAATNIEQVLDATPYKAAEGTSGGLTVSKLD